MHPIFSLDRVAFEKACSNKASGAGSPTATILGGLATLHLTDVASEDNLCLRRDGFWESWVTLGLAPLIAPGMRCWNIGASVGYYTAMMALLAGETGQVLAFEPTPHTNGKLSQSVALSAAEGGWGKQVRVTRTAVCEASGRANLYLPPGPSLNASLVPHDGWVPIRTSTITLADAAMHHGDPDVIFCDAGGSDEHIFLGSRLFERCRPIVSLEFIPSWYMAPRSLLGFFRDVGYASYLFGFDGKLERMDLDALIEFHAWGQVLFLPEGRPWNERAKGAVIRAYGT